MTMLAETVDAVIGIDTHRDNHEVEIADATGRPIATMRISNDSTGFTQLLATIADLIPGGRVVASVEGRRSYGVRLARALTAAGVCEQPSRARATERANPMPSTRTWRCWPHCD
jgi:predicted NodU family carbamoyl transferase